MEHALVVIWWTLTSVQDWFYGIFSGWFADVTIIAGGIAWYSHSRCHVDGCHKHAKYPFQHYKLCKLHHPNVPQGGVSHLHIMQLHKQAQKEANQ